MKLGAHVSTAGGVDKAFDRATEIGAEAIQMFATSPRAWKFREAPEAQVSAFRKRSEETGISPVFIHASYLINVGGDPGLVIKSVDSFTSHMNAAGRMGAAGVIFHGGSHGGVGFDGVLEQAATALQAVLANSPKDVWMIIENSAGMGSHIGSSFAEIACLIEAIGDPRVNVCLDTEHTFAAGYNLADASAIDGVMEEFDREIGLSKLVAVHANDAKVEFGSGVDRHENIGEGYIGTEGFEVIMGHPAFRDVPFILEVPGIDKKGPDKENMDRIKAIRAGLGVQP
jgi:deoxyribonuclease-4